MAGKQRATDPLIGFQYRLVIEELGEVLFTEVSGIGSEHEVIDVKVVTPDGKEELKKMPGRMKWTEVTLKRGITDNMAIWKWRKMVEDGDMNGARRNCSIQMLARSGDPAATWHFEFAWPSKVTGPNLKSDSNEFGVEEVVIQHERLYRE